MVITVTPTLILATDEVKAATAAAADPDAAIFHIPILMFHARRLTKLLDELHMPVGAHRATVACVVERLANNRPVLSESDRRSGTSEDKRSRGPYLCTSSHDDLHSVEMAIIFGPRG